uniref:Phorbol-ester/DAG-type domain-containing protein n=1 Tax=Knipowitschia caucasica TaxID=637954 RepID=A0AAV2LUN2_KNICA
MRFWGNPSTEKKKLSREKLVPGPDSLELDSADGALPGEGQENMSPPLSPSGLWSGGSREHKENKEPSPKVKRRRSVKISSVTLEPPAQWQNDALHILSCSNDYRSMNDFLMKKVLLSPLTPDPSASTASSLMTLFGANMYNSSQINDLEAEDSKKDTMVDVVYQKGSEGVPSEHLHHLLYSAGGAYSIAALYQQHFILWTECKSVRYKDLYALFEHNPGEEHEAGAKGLERVPAPLPRYHMSTGTIAWSPRYHMRHRDHSMVTKVPHEHRDHSMVTKVPHEHRDHSMVTKVEEHNGHIFKSTQYSIPTYCEFCSSLIWMMDRACVCKLCRYACHRKCCQKMTTKCSKKFDRSSRPDSSEWRCPVSPAMRERCP